MSAPTAYDFDAHLDEPDPPRRWPKFLALGVLVLLLVGGLTTSWVKSKIDPSGAPGSEVHVTIKPGMSTADVGKLLERLGVVKSATVFTYYARVTGADTIKTGEFTFHHNQHLSTVLRILQQGGTTPVDRVTIPEGLTLTEIAARVGQLPGRSADRFLALARTGAVRSQFEPEATNNLEGLVQPDTYFVDPKDDEAALLTRMVTAFDRSATEAGVADAATRLKVTPYQVIIVASMVEREAKVDEDRGPIARVIYNRLQKGMKLGVDATVEYAIGQHKARLTQSDLDVSSPYNTRKVTGLPPGPIASPGAKALAAAADPPPATWLYYVLADASGKHAFASTNDEFQRLIAQAKAKGLI
jgi:UPF0755 protein